jgi:hypothetical protein
LILSQFQAVLSDDEKKTAEALLSFVATYPLGVLLSPAVDAALMSVSTVIVAINATRARVSPERHATPNRELVTVPCRAQMPFV